MIIVCRPDRDAAASVQRLRARGLAAEARPLIERRVLAGAPWPEEIDLLFVTSPFAARLCLAARHQGRLRGGSIAALEPRTSAIFIAAGITPRIRSPGGALALAAAVTATVAATAAAAGIRGRIFYPTSLAAEREPEHHAAIATLRALGTLAVQAVYDTTATDRAGELCATAPRDATWWFHSPSAVRAYLQHAKGAPARVVCSGASTGRAWRELKPSAWPNAEEDSTLASLDKEPATSDDAAKEEP